MMLLSIISSGVEARELRVLVEELRRKMEEVTIIILIIVIIIKITG